jgi:hypothetical protein
VVFKRRNRRPLWRVIQESFWPSIGWSRAVQYVQHRLRRLPDSPSRVARGVFAGVFVSFLPLFGFHFLSAALLAWIMRGNILAALIGTFLGNPLTYVAITWVALRMGYWMRGRDWGDGAAVDSIGHSFRDAWQDLTHNFWSMFTPDTAHWEGLWHFYDNVYFPFLIGGIVPGIVVGLICYGITVPLVTAYQNRRKGALKAKLEALKKKAHLVADEAGKAD